MIAETYADLAEGHGGIGIALKLYGKGTTKTCYCPVSPKTLALMQL